MPFGLIGTVILLVLVTVFAGFNIDNKCNIDFVFHKFTDVPIFFSLMFSFILGILLTLPFAFFKRKKIEKATKAEKKSKKTKKGKTEEVQSAPLEKPLSEEVKQEEPILV